MTALLAIFGLTFAGVLTGLLREHTSRRYFYAIDAGTFFTIWVYGYEQDGTIHIEQTGTL